jgi:putative CRISPR-associated protein (TIGR02619 family)
MGHMKTILTTTGISLYINSKKEYKTDVPIDDQMRQFLRTKPEDASAEAKSLLQMAQEDDFLVFLHTETPDAIICAQLLKEFFHHRGFKHVELVQLEFQDDEKHIETRGLRNLVNRLIDEIEKARRRGQDVIINATSGFKPEIGYSTVIGMLYQVPIKYMHERFRRLVTFNPIALDWDTNLFLNYQKFFDWLDKGQPEREVENWLKSMADQERVKTFLAPADDEGNISLTPLGEALLLRFLYELEEAERVEWPPEVQVRNIKDKIAKSIVSHGHDYPKWTEETCIKLARIPYVRAIIPEHFASVTQTVIHVRDNGGIELYWTEKGKAVRLTILTTAQGRPQTIKVANYIKEKLRLD